LTVLLSRCQMGFWNEEQSLVPSKRHDNQHDSQPNHNNRCCACPECHLQGNSKRLALFV